MIRIQLIEPQTGVLDVKEGTAFPLNLSVAEIRDISKRNGKFTKTVILAGTANNNRLLNNYFSVNTVAGTFDVNKVQRCVVLDDDLPILRNAYLQLLEITNVSETAVNDSQFVEYQVLIKDATANLYTEIGNSLLSDLSFDDLNHQYTAANVISSFSHTYSDGYKYVLPYTTNHFYNLEECKPGIYVRQYLDRMFARAGFTLEISNSSLEGIINKLIIPYNGDKPIVRDEEIDANEVIATKSNDSFTFVQGAGFPVASESQLIVNTEVKDDGGHYTPGTGVYVSPYYTGNLGAINVKIRFEYEFILDNVSGATAYLRGSGGIKPTGFRFLPYFKVKNNNGNDPLVYFLDSPNNYLIQTTNASTYSIPTGETVLFTGVVEKVVPLSGVYGVQNADQLTEFIGFDVHQAYADQARWRDANSDTGTTVQVDVKIDLLDIEMEIVPSFNNVGYLNTIYMNDYIPRDIKQADLLRSLCLKFNLFLEPDENDPNKIVMTDRDYYFDNGTVKDWTKKIDRGKGETITFLPELYQKEILFTYKQDRDVVNKGYFENVGEIYGQSLWKFDNEYIKGRETRETIFSPTPCAKTTFGSFNPMINGVAPKTNIRLLYDGGSISTVNSHAYSIYNFGTSGSTGLTSYPAITHFDTPENPSFDINFGVCDYYFYDIGNRTNNNLLNMFWRRTLSQINGGLMMTVYVNLTSVDIAQIRLNDKILIENKYFNINRVIDFDGNNRTVTKVELITADDNIDLKQFPVDIFTRPVPTESNVSQPLGALNETVISTQNVYSKPTQRVLTGTENVITDGDNVIVSGYKNGAAGDNINIKGSENIVTGRDINLINCDENSLENCYNITLINTRGCTFTDVENAIIVDGVLVGGVNNARRIYVSETFSNLTEMNFINSVSGAVTISFDNPYLYPVKPFLFKRINGGANDVTLDFNTVGGSTLEGNNTLSLPEQFDYVVVVPYAGTWWVYSKK